MSINEMGFENTWTIHKFGGSSLANDKCFVQCVDIIKTLVNSNRIAVVVSAIGGKPKVTDMLIQLVHLAAVGKELEVLSAIDAVRQSYMLCILSLHLSEKDTLIHRIDYDLSEIKGILKTVSIMKMAPHQITELICGYGEIWSALILTAVLKQNNQNFTMINAKDVLFVTEQEIGMKVHWETSTEKLKNFLSINEGQSSHLVITGFIASTLDGVATTLKRDGSDFSASIFGKLLKATSITIWTDVDGIYSADPNRVASAQVLPYVSYSEAVELAYFGAKVLHPSTIAPAIECNIPIYIRNTFNPTHVGTLISLTSSTEANQERSVCGFSTVDDLALFNVEGTGMIGVPGIACKLFSALKANNISVIFIAQASSEHSICFATKETHRVVAKQAIEETFLYELQQGYISNIREIQDCSIIAAVGDSMNNIPGVAGKFFTALGMAKINVLSIAQGCDERNISAIVHTTDTGKALEALHEVFHLTY